MNSTMNFYELLGVNQNATEEEIKSAYKKQMKKWHPDINKSEDAIGMSAKINEAKEVLLDENKRRDYDIYLEKKVNESYNRYTQRTKETKNNTTNKEHEEKMVTKWEYLNEWLKHSSNNPLRKLLGVIGVMLESMFCFIIKILLIIIAFICNIGSEFIKEGLKMLMPIICLFIVLFIGSCLTSGFSETASSNKEMFKAIIILLTLFVATFVLPILSKAILSPKVFDILYNKIDINLFKKCVGYND